MIALVLFVNVNKLFVGFTLVEVCGFSVNDILQGCWLAEGTAYS